MRTFSIFSLVVLALALSPGPATAADFTFTPVTIDVPAGFEGPISANKDGAATTAFRKPHPADERAALLQLTSYDLGDQARGLSDKDLDAAAEQYLRQFLGGIERRRSGFSSGVVEHIHLGGLPAAKVQWHGQAEGLDMTGVMYCLVAGTHVVSLHTQDFGAAPTAAMKAAVKAIQGLRVAT